MKKNAETITEQIPGLLSPGGKNLAIKKKHLDKIGLHNEAMLQRNDFTHILPPI